MKLILVEQRETIDNPDEAAIYNSFNRLSDGQPIILDDATSTSDNFMQALKDSSGTYLVEYREGDEAHHYALEDHVPVSGAIDMFQQYLRGETSYRTSHVWKPLTAIRGKIGHPRLKEFLVTMAITITVLIIAVVFIFPNID